MTQDETTSTPTASNVSCVHLIEVGGRGGIFQHTKAIAAALVAAGVPVVVHTARDHESTPSSVPMCLCMNWVRHLPNGIRQPITAVGFLFVTVPHLKRAVRRDDLVHVQGTFGYWLTWVMIWRLRRSRLVFTPHNSFARSGKARHLRTMKSMARMADVTIALVERDHQVLAGWGARVAAQPLIHDYPEPQPDRVDYWRGLFGQSPTALLAGQVRRDKRPDLFIEACITAGVRPVILGPSGDGERLINETCERLKAETVRFDAYLQLDDFVAALSAADLVVGSHEVGSGSGPLAIAAELGLRTATFEVGGLGEHATAVAAEHTAASLSNAITSALKQQRRSVNYHADAASQVLASYEAAGWKP